MSVKGDRHRMNAKRWFEAPYWERCKPRVYGLQVWYGLGFPGMLCLIIFGVLTGVVAKQYQAAELRKTMAEDI